MSAIRRSWLFIAAAWLPLAGCASHPDFVVVKANASDTYTFQKQADGSAKPESYVFYRGKFFSGDTRDASMAHTSFADIAKVLAPSLARDGYFPAKDLTTADLLIVVNWGTTSIDDGGKSDPETVFLFNREMADVRDYNAAVVAYTANQGPGAAAPHPDSGNVTSDLIFDQSNAISAETFAESNASLLGYSDALGTEMRAQWASPNGLGAEAESHLADLDEERYFVILLAYDFQKLRRDGREGNRQPEPVWSVRMNVRANGNNFAEALPAMSRVAADYLGKQDDLKSVPADIGENANVEVGLVKTLDVAK
jgi:hypothetical protein